MKHESHDLIQKFYHGYKVFKKSPIRKYPKGWFFSSSDFNYPPKMFYYLMQKQYWGNFALACRFVKSICTVPTDLMILIQAFGVFMESYRLGHLHVPECYSPSQNYKEVQAVPCISKVTLLAKNPQCHHFDHHFNGKECKDEVIEVLRRDKDKIHEVL